MPASRSQIYEAHNNYRSDHDIRTLKRSSGLDASAQIVAHRLARRDKGIQHSPVWWRVIDKATKKRYGAKGENLGWGYDNISSLFKGWINSYLHKKNIRNKTFDSIGIGIAIGRHSGEPYYVTHFGDRK
jgi:uncharacterized protein YkwD